MEKELRENDFKLGRLKLNLEKCESKYGTLQKELFSLPSDFSSGKVTHEIFERGHNISMELDELSEEMKFLRNSIKFF